MQRLRQIQEDLDKKIHDLEVQHTEFMRQTGSLQSQLEEKTRCIKEMEHMMNTERTRSLLEVSQLKEALSKRKRKSGTLSDSEQEKEKGTFPSINATPIKVVDSPTPDLRDAPAESLPSSEKKVNSTLDSSSTVLSDMINNLSNVVNELGQQLNPT